LYTAQKSNSHYAPQPYTNQNVFKSLLSCTSEISLSRNATSRELQRHGPATKNACLRDEFVFFYDHFSNYSVAALQLASNVPVLHYYFRYKP